MLRSALLTCFLFVTHLNVNTVRSQDFTSTYDIQTLSELSIDKLLSVKNQFELPIREIEQANEEDVDEDNSINIESRAGVDNSNGSSTGPLGPVAMALRRKSKPRSKSTSSINRGGWEEDKSKKGIGSIFQMSITTLAFLAFGGYLLCLVVQSVKDKGGHRKKIIVITSSTAAPVTMAMFRRRRRRRRPTRIRRPQRQKRSGGDDGHDGRAFQGPTVDMTPHVDAEAMLDALVSLSEAYTRYHTVDYRRINQTIIHF